VGTVVIFPRFRIQESPGEEKGQELADAVVLFDDVALMAQIKADMLQLPFAGCEQGGADRLENVARLLELGAAK